jgi:hypothetical protein
MPKVHTTAPTTREIRSIPIKELCPQCKRGRMLNNGTERKSCEGEFDSVSYRRCERCGHKAKVRQRMIGVWVDR